MRRFSQRNSLVTLNEINITPLLDLAFVLLIIFVITRPLLEGSINVQLPELGQTTTQSIDPRDIRVVTIKANGEYFLGSRRLSLRQLEAELVQNFQQHPKLIVDIRGDKQVAWDYVSKVMDACTRHNITRITVRTAPTEGR